MKVKVKKFALFLAVILLFSVIGPAQNRRNSVTRKSAVGYGLAVAAITTAIRNIPSEVLLTPSEDGMFEDCVVNTDNIQTIRKANLSEFITHLS